MKSLPRGRHGLSRAFVNRHQRKRLFEAIAKVLDEHGYDRATVSSVSARAGVSKSDFYRQFSSKDDCFLAAYDDAVERLREEIVGCCEERRDWADGVCAALLAALAALSREPARANFLLVEGLRAGPSVYERFQRGVQSFVPHFHAGAPAPVAGPASPAGLEEAVVGGVASVLSRRVLAGEAARLEQFFPDVAEFALTPFLGRAEARRVVSAR